MQGQRNAIERMRNETLALWIADNQLQSQDSFGEENTSSSGKELINGEEWNWRSDIWRSVHFFDAAMHGWEWIFLICSLEAYGMKFQ